MMCAAPNSTYVAIAAERPRLIDFVIVAEQQELDVGLRLWVGAVDVGLVGISAGRVVFAELPGAVGDVALQLLASLPEARVVPESWTIRVTNVESHWRTLVNQREIAGSVARVQRLVAARDALRSCVSNVAVVSVEGIEVGEPGGHALQIGLELLDWAAIGAYLDGDLDRARRLLERRTLLGRGNLICRANLERLRLRLLDEELEVHLTGGGE
jgi:hypothetical protein